MDKPKAMLFPIGSRPVAEWLRRLRVDFHVRAAGVWSVEATIAGGMLRQLAFDVALNMPRDVAEEFARSTLEVSLATKPLGIVAAATQGRPAESIASELPSEEGSGHWLRAFKASRSIAVPIERDGRVVVVVAIAVVSLEPSCEVIADLITQVTNRAGWLPSV